VNFQPTKSSRGFTLIELMVAMAITTIIVTVLISITSTSLDTWNRSRAEVRAARQAQAMTEIMARDFEAMVMRAGNNFEWFVAESANGPVEPAANASPNSAEIILFTAATDCYDGQIGVDGVDLGGDISAVRYQLGYYNPMDPSEPASPFSNFVLTRRLVDPDETFSSLLAREDLKAAFGALPLPAAEDTKTYFVCENVYQFTLVLHIESFDETTQRFRTIPVILTQDTNGSVRVSGNRMELLPPNPLAGGTGRITAVEISITVLSDNALNAIRSGSTVPDDFIRSNSYQYSKRIEVPRM